MSKKIKWEILAKAAGLIAGAYGVALATVWSTQERLLFKPDPFSRAAQCIRARSGAENQCRSVSEWSYKAPDGVSIQGFLSLPHSSFTQKALESVVYLGGIREESSWVLDHANTFGDRAFVCMNYRGYGLSEGKPAQEKILNDCHHAVSMLVKQGYLKADGVHLIGRSLGSGVAGYLCSKIGAKKACLVTPYDSILNVARKKYWYLPVRLIFRHPFDAMPWAKSNEAPMMMMLSERDKTVPHDHSYRLFNAWKGPKVKEVVKGTDHNSIICHEDFFLKIASFFECQ